MKTIKPKDVFEEFKGTCSCGSIQLIESPDDLVKLYQKGDRPYDWDYWIYFFICPECKARAYVDEKLITPSFRKNVREYGQYD